MHRPRRADALPGRVVVIPARTGVHRRHERKVRRVFHAVFGPRHGYFLLFQRLSQHLQHTAPELGQFVEKQHPVVRQRHLARPRRLPAADQRHLRDGVVRSPVRPARHQPAGNPGLPGHGVYLGRLQRLPGRQRRQDRRHTPRQHRLSRTRCADHQHVVPSRRSDLQRPLGERLPLHVGEILLVTPRGDFERLRRPGHGGHDLSLAVQQRHHLLQAPGAQHVDTLHHGRLPGIVRRQHQPPQPFAAGPHGHRQHAPHGFQRPVERQLAREHRPAERPGIHAPHRREYPHGDRQVERSAFLAQVGRGEAHDHLAAGHPLPRVLERRTYALLALLDGIVRQSHQVHAEPAARDVDLDGHRHGVDPHDRTRISPDKHISEIYQFVSHNPRPSSGVAGAPFRPHRAATQNGASSSSARGVRSNSPPPIPEPSAADAPVAPFEPLA